MAEKKNQDSNVDWVGSIFGEPNKKKELSAIFSSTSKPESSEQKTGAPTITAPIRKRYPVGLDIGSSAIKVVQLGSTSSGNLRVINLGLEKLTAPHLVAETLKKVVSQLKIEGEVVSSISTDKAQIKRVDLPKMSESEIESALKWEIQQTVKVNIDDVSLDYIILPETPEEATEEKTKLLAIVVPKRDIFEHLSLIQSAGLRPKAVEADPLACYTALNYIEQFRPYDVVVFLDFGGETTSFNVIANGLRFSRNLYTTGNYLTKVISQTASLDFEKAEELKMTGGLLGDARDSILSALEKLVLDFEHSFKYFSHDLTNSKILKFDKLILTGSASNLKGLRSFLEEKLNVPVEIANPFKKVEISEEIRQKIGNFEEIAPCFCVALGLALREVS